MTMGAFSSNQLKTSLSRAQFENEQLRTEVAKLKEEHRTMEDRLVQEQIHNGDIAAQLDDARNMLRDRGVSQEQLVRNRPPRQTSDDFDLGVKRTRTQPASNRTTKPRKPPTAQIQSDFDELPKAKRPVPNTNDESDDSDTISFNDDSDGPRRNASRKTSKPAASDSDENLRWQPIMVSPSAKPAP